MKENKSKKKIICENNKKARMEDRETSKEE